jgi:hypothetical protein
MAPPPDYVLRSVLAAAELADGAVATVAAPLLARIAEAGETWAVERSAHRDEHIDQIEHSLTEASSDS